MIITRPQSDLSGKQAVAFGFHSQAMLSGFSLWQASELTNNVGKGEGFGERGGGLRPRLHIAGSSLTCVSRVSHSDFAACATGSNTRACSQATFPSCQGPAG